MGFLGKGEWCEPSSWPGLCGETHGDLQTAEEGSSDPLWAHGLAVMLCGHGEIPPPSEPQDALFILSPSPLRPWVRSPLVARGCHSEQS